MKCPLAEKGCGGCRELTRMYGDILREKDAAFRALFPDALPILGMAEPRAYRGSCSAKQSKRRQAGRDARRKAALI